VLFAQKELVLDQGGERWRTIGYDLDELDTVASGSPAECVVSFAVLLQGQRATFGGIGSPFAGPAPCP